MAEVHGNRTHLPGYSPGTPDLKSGRATSALSTSPCLQNLPVVVRKNNFFLSCAQKGGRHEIQKEPKKQTSRLSMECEQLIRLIKDWYLRVKQETMAPARMMQFVDQHIKGCPICKADLLLPDEVEKIREFVLPESKIPKAVRAADDSSTPEISPDDEDEFEERDEYVDDSEDDLDGEIDEDDDLSDDDVI